MRIALASLTTLLLLGYPCYGQTGMAAGDVVIVSSPEASPSELQAAQDLQVYLQQALGREIPIDSELAPGKRAIAVGFGPFTQSLGLEAGQFDLGEQGFVVMPVAEHVVIAGTRAAGTLYGVHDYLEQDAGLRWYAPGVERVPALDTVPVPSGQRVERPAFLWRHTSYAWPGKDEAFLTRQRDNNGAGSDDHPWGAQISHDGRCHSYFRYVSPGEFFDTHPEYFSEIGGVRREHETQLCLTNPEVLEIVTERMLQRMAERPHDRQHNFSQMDYYNYCQCDDCTAMNERYGTLGGTQFWFVNELAKRTSEVYPDKEIGTLAYMYTEEPPKGLEMQPNVAVWLCHMFPSCDSHPIATCPRDADYKRRAERWAKICDHLYIWHYVTDFAHYYNPFPNFRAMASDIRLYRDLGVEGVYLQAMGHGGGGGEFSLLRPWYGMQLLWNPDADAEALLRDFLQGYYGDAWEPLYAYVTRLHDRVEDEDIHMHLYSNPGTGYLPDETIAEAQALFDQGEEKVADEPELLERVKVARMPLVYARLFPRNGYRFEEDKLVFNGPLASLSEVGAFTGRMQRHGFQVIRERKGDPAQLAMIAVATQTPTPFVTLANDHIRADIVPWLGGRVLRIVDKATGHDIAANNVVPNLFFPFAGGEETRRNGIFDLAGMFDQYAVTEQNGRSATLVAKAEGFEFERRITLAEHSPELTIRVTARNLTDGPRSLTMRSHIDLDLGGLQDTSVQFTNRRDERVTPDMGVIIAGLREGEHYLDDGAPDGAWTFRGHEGPVVTQRWDDDMLDFAWLYAYPEDLDTLEVELWRERESVAPGEAIHLEHTLKLHPR